jgi:hypothetical protein
MRCSLQLCLNLRALEMQWSHRLAEGPLPFSHRRRQGGRIWAGERHYDDFALAFALTSSTAGQAAAQPLLSQSQTIALDQQLRSTCGHAAAQELGALSEGEHQKASKCFVRTTAGALGALLPRQIAPGVTLEAAEQQEEVLLILYLYLEARQVKLLKTGENKWAEEQANRTCGDPALVRIIDAGGAVVYLNKAAVGGETLKVNAVASCQ